MNGNIKSHVVCSRTQILRLGVQESHEYKSRDSILLELSEWVLVATIDNSRAGSKIMSTIRDWMTSVQKVFFYKNWCDERSVIRKWSSSSKFIGVNLRIFKARRIQDKASDI